MKSQLISLLGMLCAIALAASPVLDARAANINTTSNVCQQGGFQGMFSPVAVRVAHFDPGISNVVDVPTQIVCDVARSPLAPGATTGGFFVDGDNFNGASTFCVLTSYDFFGNFVASRGFTTSSPTYDQFLSLPASQLGTFNYVTLSCVLPPSFSGRLRGVTSIQ